MIKRYRTMANYSPELEKKETFFLPSLTIPDQTLTLRQLLINHTRGHDLPVQKEPIYDENTFVPHPHTLDLVDLQERRMDLQNQKDVISEQIITEKTEAKRKRLEAIEAKKAVLTIPATNVISTSVGNSPTDA